MRTGRPPLPLGTPGEITVKKHVQDGKLANGNARWRMIKEGEDPGERPVRWMARALYRDRQGRRRTVRKFSTQSGAKARNALREALRDLQKSAGVTGSGETVEKLGRAWLDWFKQENTVKPQTIHAYERSLEKHVLPTFGQLRVSELTGAAIYEGLEEISEGARSRAGTARVVLKHVCAHAVRQGSLEHNPVDESIPTYKASAKAPATITPEFYAQVRHAIKAWGEEDHPGPQRSSDLVLDVLDTIAVLGVRPGEALALQWEDIDIENRTVLVSGTIVGATSKGVKVRRQSFPKTQSGLRLLHFGPELQALFMRRAGLDVPNGHGLVFPNEDGGYMAPTGLRYKIRQALKGTPVEGFSPYRLRKGLSQRVRDQVGLEEASRVLGHSDTKVTEAHYAGRAIDTPDVSEVAEGFLRASLK